MSFEIRKLTPDDGGLLERLAPGVFDGGVAASAAAAYLSAPAHHLIVAIDDGVIVGQCEAVIHVHPDKPAHLYIEEVAVSPAWRQRGIASAMLEAMFDAGRLLGCAEVWVLREAQDRAAQRLYESLGLPGRDHVIHERAQL